MAAPPPAGPVWCNSTAFFPRRVAQTSSLPTITNNIIVDNGSVRAGCGINTLYAGPVSHMLVANNNVFGNAGGDSCAGSSTPIMSNNISVDPTLGTTFTNWQANGSGDYHQKAGSPTINNGTSSTGAPTNDFDGNPCPPGAA